MSNYIETEVKMYVPDLEAVAKRLEQIGAKLLKPRVYERNVRYENVEKSLTPSGIVVRLRHDSRSWLTYKSPGSMRSGSIRSRFEAQVEVSDFETMEKILGQLGYYPYMIYEKYRTTYEVEDDSGQAEVVLDEMPYGNFVEIEGDPKIIKALIPILELDDAPRCEQSYTELFNVLRRRLNLKFADLTFDNFKNISVPESAFRSAEE